MNYENVVVSSDTAADAVSPSRSVLFWAAWAAVTGLYLYALIAAVGNFLGMSTVAQTLTGQLSTSGTVWLTAGVVLPLLAFALALLLGRGRSRTQKFLLLATGLCLLAVMQLNIMHLVPNSSYFG